MMCRHQALFTRPLDKDIVQCLLCPHQCRISPGHTGKCRTRYNEGGMLYVLSYGQCAALALDPIEKKPLQRFHPGSLILSVGSWGCNLSCAFCQNWQIAQCQPPTQYVSPETLVNLALEQQPNGNIGAAFTYNEPLLSYEYILHTAPLLHQAGLQTVMVSNGYINEEPLRALLPHIDAWNIDLKGPDTFYRSVCGGTRAPVERAIQLAAAVSHVEVTTLVIPGCNDTEKDMAHEAQWLASIRPDIPLHITRYFPRYHYTVPPTPIAALKRLAAISKKFLTYVYIGNV